MLAASVFDVAWDQVTVGVAIAVALIYTVRSNRQGQKDILAFLGNHLSKSTEAMEHLAIATGHLANRVENAEDAVVSNTQAVAHVASEMKYSRLVRYGTRQEKDESETGTVVSVGGSVRSSRKRSPAKSQA